jgi:hypothetical protein
MIYMLLQAAQQYRIRMNTEAYVTGNVSQVF